MLIPRTGAEVSEEWLGRILDTYVSNTNSKSTFRLRNFSVNPGTKPGENFNSDLVRVEVEGQILFADKNLKESLDNVEDVDRRDAKNEEERDQIQIPQITKNEEIEATKTFHDLHHTQASSTDQAEDVQFDMMLKFHSQVVFNREVNIYVNNHIRELTLYTDVHRKLMKLQEDECNGKYKLNVPEVYHAYCKGEDYVIAMKNLQSDGYRLNDKKIGLDYGHLKLAINQLARWHGLTYVYHQKFNLLDEFPGLFFDDKSAEVISYAIEISLENVVALISDLPEFSDFLKKVSNYKDIIYKIMDVCKRENNRHGIKCLIHRDFWNNNLLYRYNKGNDQTEIPEEVSVIDWQMCQWNNPIIDLQYLIYTSTTYAVRKEHLNDLLSLYFSVFQEVISSFQISIPDFSFEQFMKDFDDMSIAGFAYGICLSQGTLSKAGEEVNQPKNSQPVDVRSLSFSMKSKFAKLLMPLLRKPQLGFLAKTALRKWLGPVKKELLKGNNKPLNERILGLVREADEKGILRDINPIK